MMLGMVVDTIANCIAVTNVATRIASVGASLSRGILITCLQANYSRNGSTLARGPDIKLGSVIRPATGRYSWPAVECQPTRRGHAVRATRILVASSRRRAWASQGAREVDARRRSRLAAEGGVRVALAQARGGDAHELRALDQLGQAVGAQVAHARAQSAHELEQHVADRSAIGDHGLDALGHAGVEGLLVDPER